MSWDVDFSSRFRSDGIGLDHKVNEIITDLVVAWLEDGPPRRNSRSMAGMTFYEEVISDRYLVAYVIDDVRQRFLMMWLRDHPGNFSQ